MTLVEGADLRRVLSGGRLDTARAIRIPTQVSPGECG